MNAELSKQGTWNKSPLNGFVFTSLPPLTTCGTTVRDIMLELVMCPIHSDQRALSTSPRPKVNDLEWRDGRSMADFRGKRMSTLLIDSSEIDESRRSGVLFRISASPSSLVCLQSVLATGIFRLDGRRLRTAKAESIP